MVAALLLLAAVSFLFSLLLTPLVRSLARRWNLVDVPDHKRKIHKKPVPRLGGVAIFAAYIGSCLPASALLAHATFGLRIGFTVLKLIAPGTFVIFLTGLIDDVIGLKPWQKLAGEVAAVSLVITAGVSIHNLSFLPVHPVVGVAATLLWLLACTNAVNLIDGMDGLAAGIVFLVTATNLIASFFTHNVELAVATAPLAGALLGFLIFNFNPASIFLGDSGSLVLGFLAGCYSIIWSAKSTTVIGVAAPVIALAVPLLDTGLAIVRRFLRAQPIYLPDRLHIHHRLLALGLTQRHAVLLLYLAAGTAGALSLCLIWVHNPWEAVIIGIFVSGAAFGVRQLKYAEFETAGRIIAQNGLRREIRAQLAVQNFEAMLSAARTADECWAIIQRGAKDFGFHPSRMQLAGKIFAPQSAYTELRCWTIRIPLDDNDWIELSHDSGPEGHATAVVPFADTIRRLLADKRRALVYSDTHAVSLSVAVGR